MDSLLEKFDFEVRHIKGKENKVADALRRTFHGLLEINISRAKSNLEQRIKVAGNNNESYTKTMVELQNTTESSDKTDLSLDKSGLLRFKNKIYISDSTELKLTVLDEVHKKPYLGHPG
jgi:hypothetical protein